MGSVAQTKAITKLFNPTKLHFFDWKSMILIVTSSATDKRTQNLQKNLEIKLEIKLEIYCYFKLENKLEIFEFFVYGR